MFSNNIMNEQSHRQGSERSIRTAPVYSEEVAGVLESRSDKIPGN